MNKVVAAIQTALKAFTLRFSGGRWGWGSWSLGTSSYTYGETQTTARTNAIVVACVRWVCRTFPEAPLQVHTRATDGTLTEQADHALARLLERPNTYYSGLQLWTATLADYLLTGNAYWVKVRSAAGRVVGLWWLPSSQVEPRWPDNDPAVFLSHYDYTVDSEVYEIPATDIVHFRDGFDPVNVRKGLSPLGALVREVATDHEAADFTASVLHNLGVPGVVITPDGDMQASEADLEEVKAKFMQRFGGKHRGEPLVLRGPSRVSVLSFSPEQLQLRELRRIPEERVTAIFGTPAVVVGLGAGLDRSTFANMAEAREAAYESLIIPLQRILLADLQHQLVPDFGDAQRLRLAHDYTQVRVLQDDQNALHERAREDLKAGLLTLNQALALIGEDAQPHGEVYYLPTTVTPRLPESLDAEPEPLPAETEPADAGALRLLEAAGMTNGNGHRHGAGRLVPVVAGTAPLEQKAPLPLPSWLQDLAVVDATVTAAADAYWDAHGPDELEGLLGAETDADA